MRFSRRFRTIATSLCLAVPLFLGIVVDGALAQEAIDDTVAVFGGSVVNVQLSSPISVPAARFYLDAYPAHHFTVPHLLVSSSVVDLEFSCPLLGPGKLELLDGLAVVFSLSVDCSLPAIFETAQPAATLVAIPSAQMSSPGSSTLMVGGTVLQLNSFRGRSSVRLEETYDNQGVLLGSSTTTSDLAITRIRNGNDFCETRVTTTQVDSNPPQTSTVLNRPENPGGSFS